MFYDKNMNSIFFCLVLKKNISLANVIFTPEKHPHAPGDQNSKDIANS